MLEIYAGQKAAKEIMDSGLDQSRFSTLLGASGGPKWFVLYGLDRFLMGDFFGDRTSPLTMIGSSVGAFRAACFAQSNPVASVERLAQRYIDTTYGSKYVTPKAVTNSVRDIIDAILEENGVANILNNPVFKAHFIVTRARGMAASENRLLQGMGLLKSSRINKQTRSNLAQQYERVIFQPENSTLSIDDPYRIPTTTIALTESNTREAILASGSLPVIMQGIKDISGAPEGCYRDGGIVDYQFDFMVSHPEDTCTADNDGDSDSDSDSDSNGVNNKGLILYPHFSASLKAGWFDKKLNRRVNAAHYDRVVLLCPGAEFISKLPFGKIPDRSDFSKLNTEERMKFWRQTTGESEQLAEQFARFIDTEDWGKIKPISDLTA